MKQNANNAHTKNLSEINQTMFDLITSFQNEFKSFMYDSYLSEFKSKTKDLDIKQKSLLLTYFQQILTNFQTIHQNLNHSLSNSQFRIKQLDQQFVENLNTLSHLLKSYTSTTRQLYNEILKTPNDKDISSKIKLLDKNLVNYYNNTKEIFTNIKRIHRKDKNNELSKSSDNIHRHLKGNNSIIIKTKITRQKSMGTSTIQCKRNVNSHKFLQDNSKCENNKNIYEQLNRKFKKEYSIDNSRNVKSHERMECYQGTVMTDYNSNITQSDVDNSTKHNVAKLSQSTSLITNHKNIINNNVDISKVSVLTLSELFQDFFMNMKKLQDTILLNRKGKENDLKGRSNINELKKNFERKKTFLINITGNIITSYENKSLQNEQDRQNKEQIIKYEQELLSLKEEINTKQKKFNEEVIQLSKEMNTLKEQNESLTAQNFEMKSHIKRLEQENKEMKIQLEQKKNEKDKINIIDNKNEFMIQKIDDNAINIVNQILIKEKGSNENSGNVGNAYVNQHNVTDLTFSEIINSTLQNNMTGGTLDIKTDEEAEINVISGTGNAAINLLEDSINEETM